MKLTKYSKEKEPHYYEYSWQPEEDNCNYYLANCFCLIDNFRAFSLHSLEVGPKVLIMGAASSGKSTISRILTNYSAKVGWETVLMDLDPENNEISALGTISAATFNEYLPVGSFDPVRYE